MLHRYSRDRWKMMLIGERSANFLLALDILCDDKSTTSRAMKLWNVKVCMLKYMISEPIHVFVSYGDADMAEALLLSGYDVNETDNMGRTALHNAIFNHDIKIVKILCNYGANPNLGDKHWGYTPFYYSVLYFDKKIFETILELPTLDIYFKVKSGWTALDSAMANKKMQCVDMIRDYNLQRDKIKSQS